MQKNYKLVLDTHCEVYDQLKPWADEEFWNFEEHISEVSFTVFNSVLLNIG